MAAQQNPMRKFSGAQKTEEPPKPIIQDDKPVQKAFRLTPAQAHELRKFCAAENITLQEAVLTGINMLLQSKGLPTI